MKDKILDQIEASLKEEDDFLVAIKKIWYQVKNEIEFNELIKALKQDKRFKVYDAETEAWEKEDEEEMEKLGYFLGPRVMLVSCMPSKEEVAKSLADKMQRMADNLQKAYETKPENMSDEDERKLLEAMKKAKELRENIDQAFGS